MPAYRPAQWFENNRLKANHALNELDRCVDGTCHDVKYSTTELQQSFVKSGKKVINLTGYTRIIKFKIYSFRKEIPLALWTQLVSSSSYPRLGTQNPFRRWSLLF